MVANNNKKYISNTNSTKKT